MDELLNMGRAGQDLANIEDAMQTMMGIVDVLLKDNICCSEQEKKAYLQTLQEKHLWVYRFFCKISYAYCARQLKYERPAQDVNGLMQRIHHQAQPRVERAGCNLVYREVPLQCRAAIRTEEMEFIIGNLISNAVRASGRHGEVVEMFVENTEDGMRIGVRDQGKGVRPEKLTELLTTQVSGHTGLDVCRKLMGELGSRLQGESRLGEGSCFWFELPACTSPPQLTASGLRAMYSEPGVPVLDMELAFLDAPGD